MVLLDYMVVTSNPKILEAYNNTQVIFDLMLRILNEILFLVPSFQNPSWDISFYLGYTVLITEGKKKQQKQRMWQKHQPVVLKLLLKPGISQFCSHCTDWSVFHAEPSYLPERILPPTKGRARTWNLWEWINLLERKEQIFRNDKFFLIQFKIYVSLSYFKLHSAEANPAWGSLVCTK